MDDPFIVSKSCVESGEMTVTISIQNLNRHHKLADIQLSSLVYKLYQIKALGKLLIILHIFDCNLVQLFKIN